MQLISTRTIPFLDSHSLIACQAQEALFRIDESNFILYLADGGPSSTTEERVIYLGLREALIWLNENPQDHGSFWT